MFLMSRTTKNPTVGSPNNPYIEDTVLLEKQAEGKKKMKMVGAVEVPQEAFLLLLKMEE